VGETYVLDSYAILALLGGEPSGEEVAQILRRAREGAARALMTWVNLGEVAYIVERRWGAERLFEVLGTLGASATLLTGDPEFRPLEDILHIQWLRRVGGV
jgi:ribonuclease VapC